MIDPFIPLPQHFRHPSRIHDHPHWRLCALMKDADGLDRVRLGDLNPKFLRLPESRSMIPFAQALFDETDGVVSEGPDLWPEVTTIAAACEFLHPGTK